MILHKFIINPGPVIIMRKQDEYKSDFKYIVHNFKEILYESNSFSEVTLFCKRNGIGISYIYNSWI